MNRKQRRKANGRQLGRGQIRAAAGKPDGVVDVLAVAYGVVDEYGTLWMPGCFQRSLAERWPTFAWAHDWSEPIGRGLTQREGSDGQHLELRLDLQRDEETRQPLVPRAHQAWAQIDSGTLDDVSVGFWPTDMREPTADQVRDFPGVREVCYDADLDEVSVVLRGAVPGASVAGVRNARGQVVPEDAVATWAAKVAAGEATVEEAKAAMAILAEDDGDGGDVEPESDPPDDDQAVVDEPLVLTDRSR